MNSRQFHSLHNHLMSLLSEQTLLFLYKRNRLDDLRMEQLKNKYPYFKESIVQNRIAIATTIEDLQQVLGDTRVNHYGQQGIFE